jgi:uncharacterized DUF497 family protein
MEFFLERALRELDAITKRIYSMHIVTLGLLRGLPVSLVHTETTHEIRIISFRKATAREAHIYFEQIGS